MEAPISQEKYDKIVKNIKAKLSIEFKHEKFIFETFKDPLLPIYATRIKLYQRRYTIQPDTTWTEITKFISAAKTPQSVGCPICVSDNTGMYITCNKCSGKFCGDCYLNIFTKNKGIIICPHCKDRYGIKHTPYRLNLGIAQIRNQLRHAKICDSIHKSEKLIDPVTEQDHADNYNKLPLASGVLNIKTFGFMKLQYKYIHESNPELYPIGDEYGGDGYDLDDIVGAVILTDTSGEKYKVDYLTWYAIGDFYKIYMIRKMHSKKDLLPIKIDFNKDKSKWMADFANKIEFSEKILILANKILIRDIESFKMFTQHYKINDLIEFAMHLDNI